MQQLTLEQAIQTAMQHHQAGRLGEAERLYRMVLNQQPANDRVLHLLGLIALQSGHHQAAETLIGGAIAFATARGAVDPDYFGNYGVALSEQGKLDEAIAAYRQLIARRPDAAVAYANLGNCQNQKGDLDAALAAFAQALRINPSFPEAFYNMGKALDDHEQLDAAADAYFKAIALRPGFLKAMNNLGVVLLRCGRFDEAISVLRQAIDADPAFAQSYCNLGLALMGKGDLASAITASREAVRLAPDFAEPHVNLGEILLSQGRFPEGWREYEWRWQANLFRAERRKFSRPTWDGSNLHGRTILLHAEQGFGDTIQFIRYAPSVARRGGRVILHCVPELARIMQWAPGVDQIVTADPLPSYDVYCPLLSLPGIFKTELGTIPAEVPYLRAQSEPDSRLAPVLQRALEAGDGKLKVGLAWSGNPKQKYNRRRSPALAQLADLGKVPGVQLYSLQKGEAAAQTVALPSLNLIDVTSDLHDLADTAALVSQLDLVITPCTAMAHLAGALGKPVWVLLQFGADWRWLLERDDSPWYPTARLFRQSVVGQWQDVVARVASALDATSRRRQGR